MRTSVRRGRGAANVCSLFSFTTAVDFLKTGVPADFPPSVRTSKSPTFMNQPNKCQYESTKVLGIIHKRIEDKIEPYRRSLAEHDELVCDRSFLYPGFEDGSYIETAFETMVEYNARLWSIMKQYGMYDEAELLSGFVTKFSKRISRRWKR